MNLQYRISKKAHLIDGLALHEVLARLHSGSTDLYAKTGVYVPEHYTDRNGNKKTTWKDGAIVTPRISYADDEQVKVKKLLEEAKAKLSEIESRVGEAYGELAMRRTKPSKKWLQQVVGGEAVARTETDNGTLVAIYDRYVHDSRLHVSDTTRKQYASMVHNLMRYQADRNVTLYLDTITPDTLSDFYNFMLDSLGNARNSAARRMKRLRSFIRWANGLSRDWPIAPLTRNNPFERYRIMDEQYGTPFYLTIDERNRLADAELPPRLSVQRDIFVFQCLIGCRISDLWGMTKENIINGAIEYIPRKTKEGRPVTVRVPLNANAKAIIDRYISNGDDRLFPFVAQQQYNEDIKEMLKMAGITRMVTILDPKTRMEVKRPIYEVATSHMARRTFIGNLYKQVKDPNLIGKLSGHTEGSKAFARYRDIDEDIAKELVSLLE